jgi:hypothetical protein
MAGDIGIGKLIGKGELRERDAIHVAVVPIVAALYLEVGERVRLDTDGRAVPSDLGSAVGIVDTYLEAGPRAGERFYVFLLPGSITSLRHDWSHPAFPAQTAPCALEHVVPATPEDRAASEAWLRGFIDSADVRVGYDELIEAATSLERSSDDPYEYVVNEGENIHFGGRDASGEIPPEFWHHAEIVTGRRVPTSHRATYFSCGC